MFGDSGWTVKLLILIRRLWTQQPVCIQKQMGCAGKTTSKHAFLFSPSLSCGFIWNGCTVSCIAESTVKGSVSFWLCMYQNGTSTSKGLLRIYQCSKIKWCIALAAFPEIVSWQNVLACVSFGAKSRGRFGSVCVVCMMTLKEKNSHLHFLMNKVVCSSVLK